MKPVRKPSDDGVRSEWLKTVVRAVQMTGGRASLTADVPAARVLFEEFVASLPDPKRPAEHLMLDGLLLQCAFRCGIALHAGVHAGQARPCTFVPALVLERVWTAGATDGRQAFAKWVRVFCGELSRTHPRSSARQAADILRERFAEPWRLETLARRFHAPPARLRREFVDEFGMSIREYQRLVRLSCALERMEGEKIEAVAYEVGYRSKKNFYRAFQQVTGLTPQAYRRLAPEHSVSVRAAVARMVSRP